MSKLYIPTTNVGSAHSADIYSVAISKPFTITASGDGYLKLWNNTLLEGEKPKDHHLSVHVSDSGVHHVDVFEDVVDSERILIVAAVTFAGELVLYKYDFATQNLVAYDHSVEKGSYWAVRWLKAESGNFLAATTAQGSTCVWELVENGLVLKGEIKPSEANFATCVDISGDGLIATGFQNGNITVSDLASLRPIYNFTGFGIKGSADHSATVRALRFSPLGGLLAVASDSGSYGVVTFYETEYGESVGTLTVPTHSSQAGIGAFAHNGWVFDLDFSSTGEFLCTAGYDGKLRVWDVRTRERVATLSISSTDIEDEKDIHNVGGDCNAVVGCKFIAKGIRAGLGADTNEGIAAIAFDRGVRWYREASGI